MTSSLTAPTREQIRERMQHWGRFLPLGNRPMWRSPVPALLADVPEFAALAAERDLLKARRAEAQRRNTAAYVEVQKAHEEWLTLTEAALLAGKLPPPEPPEYREGFLAQNLFDEWEVSIEAAEAGLLATQADKWRQVLKDAGQPARARAVSARAKLDEALADLEPFTAAAEEVKRHSERFGLRGGTTEHATDRHRASAHEAQRFGGARSAKEYAEQMDRLMAEAQSGQGRSRTRSR